MAKCEKGCAPVQPNDGEHFTTVAGKSEGFTTSCALYVRLLYSFALVVMALVRTRSYR
jgi:hypothetical protein